MKLHKLRAVFEYFNFYACEYGLSERKEGILTTTSCLFIKTEISRANVCIYDRKRME